MKTIKWLSPILLVCAATLAGAFVFTTRPLVTAAPPPAEVYVGGPLPLPVQPARDPVQAVVIGACPNIGFDCGPYNVYTVPPDKWLVIEHFSMIVDDITVPVTIAPRIFTKVHGNSVNHELGMSSESQQMAGVPKIIVSRNVKLYADPGSTVQSTFLRSVYETPSAQFAVQIKISGYLVPVP